MGKYILKRILLLIPTLFVILTLVFLLMRLIPGSPVYALVEDLDNPTPELIEQLEEEMGFNDPIIVQYFRYVKNIFIGDWGVSYFNDVPVFKNMMTVWEPTILITIYATIITVVIAIPVGILSATHRNSVLDYMRTIFRHILPACSSFLLVRFSTGLSGSILSMTSLSYLGVGLDPTIPSWGSMIQDGQRTIFALPHMVLYPALAICLTIFAFSILGDGLRDILDPKLR